MKIVRALLIVFGVAIVATALATAAAFVPAVQRWALLRIAAGRPGTSLRVERLAVRPGSINVHRLQLVRPGLRVTLDDVAAGFSLWEAVAHRRLVVRDLRITGLQVDLTNPPQAGGGAFAGTPPPLPSSPSTATASPATDTPPEPAFAGILNHLQPPFEIVVASCHAEAEIILPGTAGRPARHLRVILTGGHFAPGRQAQFDFEAAIHGQDSSTPVDQIEGRGVLTATLDRQSRFERIGVHLEATASGPLLPARARLEADVTVARTAEGETYALALRSPEAGGENRLLDLEVAYVAGVARLAGSWQVRASRQQVAPFTLGATLPEFSAVGEGRFELNPAIRRARLTGRIAGGISQLEVLDPRLRAVGRLGATAAFDLEYGGDEVRISQLVVSLSGRKSVLTMEAVQPFSIELASQVLTAADPRRELLQVNLEGLPLAWARPFLPAIELAGDEVTGAFVASLREGRMWLRTTSPLAVRNFALARSGRVVLAASDIRIQAELEHAKTATRIKLDALTLETAAGDRVDAQGEWNLESGIPAVTTLRASVTAVLPTLLAAYAPVGPVQGRGAVVCTASGGIWQVDHLDARVTTPEGRVLLDLSSGVAFQFDHARWKVAASAAGSSEVLRLEFGRLPLAMFQPYLGVCRLGGDLLPGELRARLDQGGLRVAAATPLHVEQFAAGGAGGAWVRDLSVELEPVADFAAEGVTVKLAAARVSNAGGAPLLSAHAEAVFGTEAGSPGVRGTAGFDLSVPALAGQPILGGRLPPTQGRIAGEGKFTFDRDLRGEGRITLNGLVSPATHEPLPVANLSFRAGWSEQGTVAVQVPLLIDRSGERSDLTVAATLRPDDHGRQLEARISGQHFVVDDARALIHAFGPPPAAPAGEPPAGVPASAAPWAALSGQVTLDVKSLVCDRNLEVTGLAGRITLAPGRLAAEKITGRLGAEGQLQFSGEARFARDAAQPYTARFDLQVRDFDIGPLFGTTSPRDPPALEGRFNVRSQAEGTGRTWGELVAQTRGDYVLQSRQGVFRGLQRTPVAPHGSGIVGGAARLIDNLGEKVGNLVSYDEPTEELAGQLAAFPYDQLNVRLARDPARNLKISDFTLVSPVVRLQGDGLVVYQPGKSMFDRPLQMHLVMGVMGKAEAMVARFRSPALAGERDELGFMRLRERFAVVGTLARPDAGQLYASLKPSLRERLLP